MGVYCLLGGKQRTGFVGLMSMTRDHVCDMEVDEATAAATTTYKGDTYYFCSVGCKRKFEADPERYVSRTEASQS
jgi:Cu+-exporting ATPase